jgi:hypothetical protein
MKRTSTEISFSDASSTDLSIFFREEERNLAANESGSAGEPWASQVSVFWGALFFFGTAGWTHGL